jgi:hypothetical protein
LVASDTSIDDVLEPVKGIGKRGCDLSSPFAVHCTAWMIRAPSCEEYY